MTASMESGAWEISDIGRAGSRASGAAAGRSYHVFPVEPLRSSAVSSLVTPVASIPFSTPAHGLTVDGVPLADIAATAGTPVYVYSAGAIRDAYMPLDAAFGGYPHAVHYALKANSALEIVRLLRGLGSSVDANSMTEVDVALRCG